MVDIFNDCIWVIGIDGMVCILVGGDWLGLVDGIGVVVCFDMLVVLVFDV